MNFSGSGQERISSAIDSFDPRNSRRSIGANKPTDEFAHHAIPGPQTAFTSHVFHSGVGDLEFMEGDGGGETNNLNPSDGISAQYGAYQRPNTFVTSRRVQLVSPARCDQNGQNPRWFKFCQKLSFRKMFL